jgi:hypothetical protein
VNGVSSFIGVVSLSPKQPAKEVSTISKERVTAIPNLKPTPPYFGVGRILNFNPTAEQEIKKWVKFLISPN